jgi:hypothetical protein
MYLSPRVQNIARPWPEGCFSLPPGRGGWAAFLLACAAALSFGVGLFWLAVLPPSGVDVPRWCVLAYGMGCTLPALLALWLGRPPRRPEGSMRQGRFLLIVVDDQPRRTLPDHGQLRSRAGC